MFEDDMLRISIICACVLVVVVVLLQRQRAEVAVAQEDVPLTGTKAGELREISLPGGVMLNQIWCPAGTFTMGSPANEPGRIEDEDDT